MSSQALLYVPPMGKFALPHSYSSPELPVPPIETSTSTPLVTLHNTPLVSPNSRAPDITNIVVPVPTIRLPTCLDNNPEEADSRLRFQSKKHGRSHIDTILPCMACELTSSIRSGSCNSSLTKSSRLLSHRERITGTARAQVQLGKRSRSLSPYLPRCLCYNCNVSELILRSRDLPPMERSNFDTYFARSLSHKFFNCSCYSSNLYQGESNCSSCSISSNDSYTKLGWCTEPQQGQSNPTSFNCSMLVAGELSTRKHPLFKRRQKWRFDKEAVRRTCGGGSAFENVRRSIGTMSCPNLNNFLLDDSVCSMENFSANCSLVRKCWSCTNVTLQWGSSLVDVPDRVSTLCHSSSVHGSDIHGDHDTPPRDSNHRSKCPRVPFSRLQPQRSFSSPDTRPSIIQPDPTCTARRHRHGISGQMSYFKLLGYNINKKLTGSANSLFSTAVISGSSSAPNLKDMVPPHASAVAAIEGFGGVPPIRPLETLHNALSLRQLDSFLEMMTTAPLFRTPASSPPKYPSPGGSTHESVNPSLSVGGINCEYHSSDLEAVRYITAAPIQYKSSNDGEPCDIRNQLSPTSPNSTGWSSEPQSFVSSEPSSPAPTSTGECSMSISLISNEGAQSLNTGPKYPTTPCLDVDFNDFCMNIDQEHRESRGSVSYTDYYSNEDGQIRKCAFGTSFGSNLQRMIRTDDLPIDNMDDDEERTITLKQTEEQKKQDVKRIFEQQEKSRSKPSTSCKKIGRFLVESMDIVDEDVRIKEPDVFDKAKPSTSQKTEFSNTDRAQRSRDTGAEKTSSSNSYKRKNFSRSQSVSTPEVIVPSTEANRSYKCMSKLSSLSNMADKNLEEWKQILLDAKPPSGPLTSEEESILTVTSSLTNSSSVTIGFNVHEENRE